MLDEDTLLEDRAHGVTTGLGIGAILTGFSSTATTSAAFIVDDFTSWHESYP